MAKVRIKDITHVCDRPKSFIGEDVTVLANWTCGVCGSKWRWEYCMVRRFQNKDSGYAWERRTRPTLRYRRREVKRLNALQK